MQILKQVMNVDARSDLTLTPQLNRFQCDDSPRQFFDIEKELIVQRKQVSGSAEQGLTGLALSGGGIRSATFCLGALQVFESKKLMSHVDYLSTVSGGGFVGAAYSAWRYRRMMFAQAAAPQDGDAPACPAAFKQPPASLNDLLLHLRKFAHYLSPRLGLVSSEPWRIVGAFVRNLVIHWLVMASAVFALFASLLLAQRHLYAVTVLVAVIGLLLVGLGWGNEVAARRCMNNPARPPGEDCPQAKKLLQAPHLTLFAGLALCGLSAALGFVASTRVGFPDWTPLNFFSTGIAPLSTWLDRLLPLLPLAQDKALAQFNPGLSAALMLLVSAALVITICGFASEWRWRPRRRFVPNVRWLALLLGLGVYLGLWGALAASQNAIIKTWASVPLSAWEFLSFTTVSGIETAWAWVWQGALVIFGFAVMLSLFIAVFNREMDREEREWSTRLISIALMTGSAWLVIAGLVTLSTWLAILVHVALQHNETIGARSAGALAASAVWIGVSSWAARLASSTTLKGVAQKYWKQFLLKLGPPLFLVGLVILCGFAAALLVLWAGGPDALWIGSEVWWLLAVSLLVFAISGAVLDSNEFSLHGFYRDRIVRSYLGASNADSPAADSTWNIRTDDVPLHCLAQSVKHGGAPFHIINTAVNLFGSKDLQVQQRSCDSFVLTPTGCGSWATNYAPMPTGLYLGSAVAASGAAVSSNMGMVTRGASLAALMTVFNLRLGFWFGNPRKNAQLRKRPTFAPSLLLLEGFSMTNENRQFVNLSDGGHFDNLGLYELIRRRCKFIIVLDAECDEKYGFESLEQVIRFVRIDFNVHIDVDFQKIAPLSGTTYASAHWVLGTIDYSQVTPGAGHDRGLSPHGEAQTGHLLYIKSSLRAPEQSTHVSRDVIGYAKRHPNFPHEPTSDQFFSEAQFESYRELGHCIATKLLEGWAGQEIATLFAQHAVTAAAQK